MFEAERGLAPRLTIPLTKTSYQTSSSMLRDRNMVLAIWFGIDRPQSLAGQSPSRS